MFRRSRGRGRSRSSRKTRWTGGVFQGTELGFNTDVTNVNGGEFSWVSFWFKWPGGHFTPPTPGAVLVGDPLRLEPSDETLVRTINSFSALATFDGTGDPAGTYDIVTGLIAWDGGEFPESFDTGNFFATTSSFAPPHPIVDLDDDWILRNAYSVTKANPAGLDITSDSFINSKAKRKLPPDTGVLGVIGVANVIDGLALTLTWNWDVRLAVRTGYTA